MRFGEKDKRVTVFVKKKKSLFVFCSVLFPSKASI